ncbi:hypothetical protein [Chrysochromulina parva virus BQ2]|uniref:Uncharacterized protein n=1 Tax=Chrysochromulina parva virus BQ2 TaxID=3070831 RepID=A0A4Y6GS03_9VIRU|nr:hypothetical protein QKE47_gp03 [Chrysochromulina parva virus]QDF45894.1 hypothetical protein [Chrysochromulina parva virus BQ2]
MSSRQLYDLTPEELADHAQEIHEAAGEALAAARRERRGVGVGMEAARAVAAAKVRAAKVRAAVAYEAIDRADMAADLPDMEEAENAEDPYVSTNAEAAAEERAAAIAKLDILHRQQMMGEWSRDINDAVINEQTKKAVELVKKQEVKKHMGSMLGDWDKAGKLSKRRIRKTKMKTKRRRQKITKRRRK